MAELLIFAVHHTIFCSMQHREELLAQFRHHKATLVAVTKTQPPDRIQSLYDLGVRDFGENRVQELLEKAPLLPDDIRWHLIGHLQTNKVKYIAPFIHLIHSVDSPKLLQEIDKQAAKVRRKQKVLFQFHIAQEESKYGIPPFDFTWLKEVDFAGEYPNVAPCGLMGMATFTEDEAQIRREFRHLKSIFDELSSSTFSGFGTFKEISMGMSSDYKIALEEGSTLVRIGSLLFNEDT